MLNKNHDYQSIMDFMEKYEETDVETIKKRMRYYRRQRGITPQFFEINNIMPVGTVKMTEKLSYKSRPTLETLIRYCYGLNITLEDLLKPVEIDGEII